MIVSLETLKRALGLDPDDESEDELLTDLEARAAAWVEEQTERRWQAPETRTEVIEPKGRSRFLRLNGHVDDPDEVVALRRRAINGGEWEDVDADLDDPADAEFERRGDLLVHRNGMVPRGFEYEATYENGWGTAPLDIQDLVIDLIGIAYSGLGEEGVKSESLGDYSYTLDTAVTAAQSSLSDTSAATLNRRRQMHV